VNTCGFIESAKKESIEAVISQKAAHPGAKVLVAGCLSQRYAAELAGDLAEADGIVGNADPEAVVAAAEAAAAGSRPVVAVPAPALVAGTTRPRGIARKRLFDYPGTAHVKITEGCSNGCAYCAIPLIRGGLRSRPVDEVLEECRELLARGIRELVFIGQDLGSYGREIARDLAREFAGDAALSASVADGPSLLPDLLRRLSAEAGDFRARIMYIHPDNFPEAILPVMAADPRLLPYFDIPFQHASERILRAMNRRGSPEAYLGLVSRIRKALPDAALRSTFLLGFPGETDEDLGELLAFQEEARLDWAGTFAFSREEGTAAYAMRARPAKKLVLGRIAAVEEVQSRITRERLQRFVGRDLDVLVEERLEGESLSIGRAWNQAPDVDGLTVLHGEHESGTIVRARVEAVNGVDFEAVPAAR
ncbi:MAG: MiaB/RimO family radical SAM methylthiotransferase, partial [Spirochaetaceae bacterium]|nr:MiaB/RimO family radical SAM methylthiotransferase [Spirochaetaceae bacterium]